MAMNAEPSGIDGVGFYFLVFMTHNALLLLNVHARPII